MASSLLLVLASVFLIHFCGAFNEEAFSLSESFSDPYSYQSEEIPDGEESDVDVHRRNDNNQNFLRFGRNFDDYPDEFTRPTRKTDNSDFFIRFGRNKDDFLRFGRNKFHERSKREVHTGNGGSNFLRFGRLSRSGQGNSKVENGKEDKAHGDRNKEIFMKKNSNSNFLRFGRRNDSNFLRFGRLTGNGKGKSVAELLTELLEAIKERRNAGRHFV